MMQLRPDSKSISPISDINDHLTCLGNRTGYGDFLARLDFFRSTQLNFGRTFARAHFNHSQF